MQQPTMPHGPARPTVPASQPELEQRVIEEVNAILTQEDARHVLYPEVIHEYLLEFNLDTDENGFIIRANTGEHVPPYKFDADKYSADTHSTDDDESTERDNTELSEYFVAETEKEWVDDDLSIHLSNLHGFIISDGDGYPVSDYVMDLERFRGLTGSFFTITTAWSSMHSFGRGNDDLLTNIHVKKTKNNGEHEKPLHCFNCGFNGCVNEWDSASEVDCGEVKAETELRERLEEIEEQTGNDEPTGDDDSDDVVIDDEELRKNAVMFDDPVCPECHAKWDSEGLVKCESCGDEQWRAGLEHTPDMCYECNELGSLQTITRKLNTSLTTAETE